MKTILNFQFSILNCLCLLLYGCITEYEAKDIEKVASILVVEGVITDDESVIILSRSADLNHDDTRDITAYSVPDAKVYIECDDGTQWEAENHHDWDWDVGRGIGSRYAVTTGKLNPERQYRLKIEMEAHEYYSEFACPMDTPEIDSVFRTKEGAGQPVNIHVATQATDGMAQYYRWSYREDWESRAKITIPIDTFNYMCSNSSNSREILIGTTEKTASDKLIEIIAKIPAGDDRFEILYRIDVAQNTISKRAFDYYTNIKKNSQQAGGIFAHVPSEIKGNITCFTDPARTVIGYVDVSSTTRGRLYIYRSEGIYEDFQTECELIPWDKLFEKYGYIPPNYIYHSGLFVGLFVEYKCIDCIVAGGRPIDELPDDWPVQYVYDEK